MKNNLVLIASWIVLNILDSLVTVFLLSKGGAETNTIIAVMNLPQLAIFKIVMILVVITVLYLTKRIHLLLPMNLGLFIVVIYTARWIWV